MVRAYPRVPVVAVAVLRAGATPVTAVTATNMSYNGAIAAGGKITFGFQASFSGTNAAPTLSCSAT